MNVLFVTWDGPQVSYLESLFLPIFRRLSEEGIRFYVLQFTWGDLEVSMARQIACEQAGVTYRSVFIWRRPLAVGALLSAVKGSLDIRKAIKDFGIDVLMPRSTLPALATLLNLRGSSLPMVFDADGLPLDERVDFAGQSPTSLIHRLLRDVEVQAVRRADVVLTRSSKAVEILHSRAGAGTLVDKFYVVTNGRDAEHFKLADAAKSTQVRRNLGLSVDAPLIVYAGSMGPQYCMDEMLRLFAKILERRLDAHFLVLTGSPEAVRPVLDKYPQLQGCVTTLTVSAQAVPQYLGCADLGLALRQPSFSMQAVAPIKLGEYLLCGLPVVATVGVGDTDSISVDAGFLLVRMDSVELKAAADWFIDYVMPRREAFRNISRNIGISRFSMAACTLSYMNAITHVAALSRTNSGPKTPSERG